MKGLIRLAYRKLIEATSPKNWDKAVFEDTYLEFYMQAQRLDPAGTYPTLRELLDNVPNAEQLHYLSSRAAVGYLRQLNQRIPDVTNAFGQESLPFEQFKFELLASDVRQKAAHRIAIDFYSDPLTWIDTIDGKLLITYGDQRDALRNGQQVSTDLIALQPNLSVWSYQP